MKELKHLMYFERLLDDAHNELVRQAEAEGDLAIGYTCFHAPEVLLNLGSCFSVRLRAPHTTSMELATYYMANNSCEFSRAILERALEGNYGFLHAMAGVDVCEANNRAIENMEIMHAQGADKDKFFYCNLDIPYSDDEDCVEHICEQVSRKILKPMRENYGVDTSTPPSAPRSASTTRSAASSPRSARRASWITRPSRAMNTPCSCS